MGCAESQSSQYHRRKGRGFVSASTSRNRLTVQRMETLQEERRRGIQDGEGERRNREEEVGHGGGGGEHTTTNAPDRTEYLSSDDEGNAVGSYDDRHLNQAEQLDVSSDSSGRRLSNKGGGGGDSASSRHLSGGIHSSASSSSSLKISGHAMSGGFPTTNNNSSISTTASRGKVSFSEELNLDLVSGKKISHRSTADIPMELEARGDRDIARSSGQHLVSFPAGGGSSLSSQEPIKRNRGSILSPSAAAHVSRADGPPLHCSPGGTTPKNILSPSDDAVGLLGFREDCSSGSSRSVGGEEVNEREDSEEELESTIDDYEDSIHPGNRPPQVMSVLDGPTRAASHTSVIIKSKTKHSSRGSPIPRNHHNSPRLGHIRGTDIVQAGARVGGVLGGAMGIASPKSSLTGEYSGGGSHHSMDAGGGGKNWQKQKGAPPSAHFLGDDEHGSDHDALVDEGRGSPTFIHNGHNAVRGGGVGGSSSLEHGGGEKNPLVPGGRSVGFRGGGGGNVAIGLLGGSPEVPSVRPRVGRK